MLDAQRAIRLTRYRARDWNIDPSKVGVLGFSAGGHLTTTVLTHFDAGQSDASDPLDRPSCKPDFGIPGYAVIAFGEEYTHRGSQTPPCFVWHTAEDQAVPAENSLRFYSTGPSWCAIRAAYFRRG